MTQGTKDAGFFARRRRVLLAAGAGLAAGALALVLRSTQASSALIGWDVAAVSYVVPTLWLILTAGEEEVRRRARLEDEDRFVLTSFILASVGLSLAAIVYALKEAKLAHGRGEPPGVLFLSVGTLALSWLVVQCLYTLHYAHRYFGDRDDDGKPDGGIQFPGGPPTTYHDFLYVSICVGSTCQVSDVNITATKYRNLVTSQAVVAFVFNTMVLALGINIVGNLMGQ